MGGPSTSSRHTAADTLMLTTHPVGAHSAVSRIVGPRNSGYRRLRLPDCMASEVTPCSKCSSSSKTWSIAPGCSDRVSGTNIGCAGTGQLDHQVEPKDCGARFAPHSARSASRTAARRASTSRRCAGDRSSSRTMRGGPHRRRAPRRPPSRCAMRRLSESLICHHGRPPASTRSRWSGDSHLVPAVTAATQLSDRQDRPDSGWVAERDGSHCLR